MKITMIGKTGCTKCAKMAFILKERGYEVNTIYADKVASISVMGHMINIDQDTHFPLYYYNDILYTNYKDLNDCFNKEKIDLIKSEDP